MSVNQKILAAIAASFVVITLAIFFVFFSPPLSGNTKVNLCFIVLAEILLGASIVAVAGSKDRNLPFNAGAPFLWLVYLLATLILTTISSFGIPAAVTALFQVIALLLAAIAQSLFWMAGRHIAEQDRNDAKRLAESGRPE